MATKPIKVKLKFRTLYNAITAGDVKPFKGEKDSYLDLLVWVNSEKDEYGRYGSVSVDSAYLGDESKKVYVGDVKSNPNATDLEAPAPKQEAPQTEDTDDLPF